eukprot:6174425-Pleurochrysis_carterae.AAC.2
MAVLRQHTLYRRACVSVLQRLESRVEALRSGKKVSSEAVRNTSEYPRQMRCRLDKDKAHLLFHAVQMRNLEDTEAVWMDAF